jgi:hypothetical protein
MNHESFLLQNYQPKVVDNLVSGWKNCFFVGLNILYHNAIIKKCIPVKKNVFRMFFLCTFAKVINIKISPNKPLIELALSFKQESVTRKEAFFEDKIISTQ